MLWYYGGNKFSRFCLDFTPFYTIANLPAKCLDNDFSFLFNTHLVNRYPKYSLWRDEALPALEHSHLCSRRITEMERN